MNEASEILEKYNPEFTEFQVRAQEYQAQEVLPALKAGSGLKLIATDKENEALKLALHNAHMTVEQQAGELREARKKIESRNSYIMDLTDCRMD